MNETQQLIALVAATVSVLGTLAGAFVYLLKHVRSIEIRVDRVDETTEKLGETLEETVSRALTTWDFILRRGEIEAQDKEFLNADGTVTQSVLARFAGLVADLQRFAHGEGKLLPRAELAVEIERRWGARIVQAVCRPLKVSQGACIVLALALCQAPTLQVKPKPPAA